MTVAKSKNILELEAKILQLEEQRERTRQELLEQRSVSEAAKATEKETRKQFNDLKERLSNAEMENNRLRGYVQRVQEDDVVREELVQTGDPEGEVRIVPKRRPTSFTEPAVVSDLRDRQSGAMGYMDNSYRDRDHKPKHWITY